MTEFGEIPDFGESKGGVLSFRNEFVFLYLELLNFPVERRTRNSELDGRAIWPRHFSFALGQSGFDHVLFLIPEGLCQST